MIQAVIRIVLFRRQFEAVRASPQFLEKRMGPSRIIQDCHEGVYTVWRSSNLDSFEAVDGIDR